MASERENFSLSGPFYLTAIDWRNASHRRSIAASLVKGVSVLEHDHRQNRQGSNALAPPWWESFQFCLIQTLVDSKDGSIFGAIYKYEFPNYNYYSTTSSHNQNPPKYVIAFRGTIKKTSQDMKLNLRVIVNRLHSSPRFHIGLQAVQNIVHINHGAYDIWLAGYSLGSAIALIIGRDMVKMGGIYLETYLFNPPFASLPIEKINNDTLKHEIHRAHSVITARLAFAVNMISNQPISDDGTFTKLCGWIPYLFVNRSDWICSEYFGYFKHREKMVKSGDNEIARIATQNSIRSIIATAIGKESEPSQHLPSAYLVTNLSPCPNAHKINQWWTPDLHCNYKLYQFW